MDSELIGKEIILYQFKMYSISDSAYVISNVIRDYFESSLVILFVTLMLNWKTV